MQHLHVRMMPTLLVQMFISGESVGLYRALVDTGSETELIHQKTIEKWYHNSTPTNVDIVGLGDSDIWVKRKIEVELRPWYDTDGQTTLKVTLDISSQKQQHGVRHTRTDRCLVMRLKDRCPDHWRIHCFGVLLKSIYYSALKY